MYKRLKWLHCKTHNLDYPSSDGCPLCNKIKERYTRGFR